MHRVARLICISRIYIETVRSSQHQLILSKQHGSIKGNQKGRQEDRTRGQERQAPHQEKGIFLDLRLQGPEAGSPRYRHQLKGHVHHELFRQRHLREDRR